MKILRLPSHLTTRLLVLSLLAFGTSNAATAADQVQSVRSASSFASERGALERRDTESLQYFESQQKEHESASGKQAYASARHLACCGYRIYSARTELFDDLDGDGFYTYLRVSVDIDTDYAHSELYLQVYLRGEYGGWTQIFDSYVFSINGNSALDAYEVESELLSGYPTDYYDVLVEIYDAYTGEMVLDYGPAENAAFSLLPMEEVLLDARTRPAIALSSGGGGGSLSLVFLAGLLLLLSARVVRRRSAMARAR